MKISLIITLQDDGDVFSNLINYIKKLDTKPDEIIFVDSSTKIEFSELIKKEILNLNIKHTYTKINKSYQGKALNHGIELSNYEYIALLDSKTFPIENWLTEYKKNMKKNNVDIVWGSTIFKKNTFFQQIYRCATYGKIIHKTLPGSLINKNIFKNKKYYFNENIRSSFDIEWKDIIKENHLSLMPNKFFIIYGSLPKNILNALKKHTLYAFYTSLGKSEINIKEIYVSIFLILSAIILPKWNFIISGWNNNPLYIPNVTKIYLICLIIIFLFYLILKKIKIFKKNYFFEIISKTIFFFLFSYGIYKWNASIASWVENSIFYIPHITKIYISILIIGSFVYRGLVRPIKRKEEIKFLLPFNWIIIGFMGLTIDLIKSPFYVFVSVITNFLRTLRLIK